MSSYSYVPRARIVRAALISALVVIPTIGAVRSIALGRTPELRAADRTSTLYPKRADDPASLHMLMTPARAGTTADTMRAGAIVSILRKSIAKYRDTTAAVADGYKMFAPQIKQQKVYHFTNSWLAVQEAFRFDPAKPASLLYTKRADGSFVLVGAMYVAPKRFSLDQLDERIPLSIARWHKHVNWCIPGRGDSERWLERKDGHPVFGPESPIATKQACDAVNGAFRETIFSWMVHANVFAGDDPRAIWGDEHAGHDMHDGMKMDGAM
jgi:hypothetical protein